MKAKPIIAYFLLACIVFSSACSTRSSPEEALQRFYATTDVPEENLMDPLIVAGKSVVPLVLENIRKKEMPRRRYAIAFLGNGAYPEALPILESILKDSTEKDIFRGDALQAICQINNPLCSQYAAQYKAESNFLGDVAKQILLGADFSKQRRSYFAAWLAEL